MTNCRHKHTQNDGYFKLINVDCPVVIVRPFWQIELLIESYVCLRDAFISNEDVLFKPNSVSFYPSLG